MNGKGASIEQSDLLAVAESGNITARRAKRIVAETLETVAAELGEIDNAFVG